MTTMVTTPVIAWLLWEDCARFLCPTSEMSHAAVDVRPKTDLANTQDGRPRWLWRLVRRNAEVENLGEENHRFDEIGKPLLTSTGEAGLEYLEESNTKSGRSNGKTGTARLLKDSGSMLDNFFARRTCAPACVLEFRRICSQESLALPNVKDEPRAGLARAVQQHGS